MVYFFDFDGTLVDSMPYIKKAQINYLRQYDIELTDDIWAYVIAIGYYNTAKYYVENFNMDKTPEEVIDELFTSLVSEYANNIVFKPNAKEYVKKLKNEGHKVYIVSASPLIFINPCLEHNDMAEWFDGVISTDEFAPYSKCDVEFFGLVANKVGVATKDVIYVEDSLTPIQTASKTDITIYAVKDVQPAHQFEEIKTLADKVIYDYKELL